MRAGAFDREVTVEMKSVSKDASYGSETILWVPLEAAPGSPVVGVRFMAQVKDVAPSRSESVKQGLAVARNQTKITLRYRSDIDSTMRITVHGDVDQIYQIVGGPAVVGRRREMIEMVCERYSTDGQGA